MLTERENGSELCQTFFQTGFGFFFSVSKSEAQRKLEERQRKMEAAVREARNLAGASTVATAATTAAATTTTTAATSLSPAKKAPLPHLRSEAEKLANSEKQFQPKTNSAEFGETTTAAFTTTTAATTATPARRRRYHDVDRCSSDSQSDAASRARN